jgi:uncharacterized membrane protein
MKFEKGTAGLNILLGVITMIFVIGLIVMVFALMGGELSNVSYQEASGSVDNETLTTVTEAGEDLSVSGLRDVSCSVSSCYNATAGGGLIPASNYTATGCSVAVTVSTYNNTNWKCSYSYTHLANSTASDTIGDTTDAIGGVTSYFPIIIVITAMIVLVLLTIIIISAIKGSGMVATA